MLWIHARRFGSVPQIQNGGRRSLLAPWIGGVSAPAAAQARRGGGTYLTQAELRKLRRQLDKQEAKERAEQQAIGQTVEQTYEDIAHPEIRIARETAVRARQRQEQIDQDEQEFLLFLLDNYDTLH